MVMRGLLECRSELVNLLGGRIGFLEIFRGIEI